MGERYLFLRYTVYRNSAPMSAIHRKCIQKKYFRKLIIWLGIVWLLILFIYLYCISLTQLSVLADDYAESDYNVADLHLEFPSITKELNTFNSNEKLPTIARVLYLFLCENQDEINAYAKTFPTTTADVMFFCWRASCYDLNFSPSTTLYISSWAGRTYKDQLFVRSDPASNYTKVQPRMFIINEHQLNLSSGITWPVARNILLDRALLEEGRQGWRWAYYTFSDGNIQLGCPLAGRLRKTSQSDGDEIVFAKHFRSLMDETVNSSDCFVLFDAFLLSASPAIGVIGGPYTLGVFDDFVAEIVYHVGTTFNAFHRDAMPFVLPYCARYSRRSWWISQAILVYRSLCLYGHVIQLKAVEINRQKHRPYLRWNNPGAMNRDMKLFPPSLVPFQMYMKQSRLVSALVLRHYSGWSLGTTSDECRQKHTFMDPFICKVGAKPPKSIEANHPQLVSSHLKIGSNN